MARLERAGRKLFARERHDIVIKSKDERVVRPTPGEITVRREIAQARGEACGIQINLLEEKHGLRHVLIEPVDCQKIAIVLVVAPTELERSLRVARVRDPGLNAVRKSASSG